MNVLLCALLSTCIIWTLIGATGRPPNARDNLACRSAYRDNLANVTALYDPRATLQAYRVRDGNACSTYCRIRSRDPRVATQTLPAIAAPEYEQCARNRHCNNNSTCVDN